MQRVKFLWFRGMQRSVAQCSVVCLVRYSCVFLCVRLLASSAECFDVRYTEAHALAVV